MDCPAGETERGPLTQTEVKTIDNNPTTSQLDEEQLLLIYFYLDLGQERPTGRPLAFFIRHPIYSLKALTEINPYKGRAIDTHKNFDIDSFEI